MGKTCAPGLRRVPRFFASRPLNAISPAFTLPIVLIAILVFVLSAVAQQPKVITVAEALRDANGDYIPDRLGEIVSLRGVITAVADKPRHSTNLQDSTGGIPLYEGRKDQILLFEHFKPGDWVQVRGQIGQYKGNERLLVEEISLVGTAPLPEPRRVKVADLLGEKYCGQLVRVSGQLLVPADPGERQDLKLDDEFSEIRVHLHSSNLVNPKFLQRLVNGEVEIVGIVEQKKEVPPFNSGYRLVPRGPGDFKFAWVPPYRAIALACLFLLLATVTVNLWRRRRDAERRAQEMAARVAERKRAEAALRESEERFRELFENANDLIYTQGLTGNFTSFNRAGERITGYGREEALQMHMTQLVAPEYVEPVRQEIRRQFAGEGPRTYELEIIAKGGRRVALEVSSRLIYQQGEPVGLQGIARDVTERKQLEAQLRQSQKMEAVGRLAGGIAHDFNNMLTVIKGYSDLLEEQLDPSQERERRAANEINQAADRAASLTRQLLAYSRRQVLEPKVLDLNEVVTNLERMLCRLIGEDVELVTFLKSGLGRVKADPGQIEQVLMNLAVNARDAMTRGGKLTVETENLELDRSQSRDGATMQPGSYVVLSVSDTGCGMNAETRARIFEPFFTTKEQGKGTGLGLATVYGIVKQSGGYIWVDSELGRGATFKIYLPRIEEPTAAARSVRSPAEASWGSETVLLVEDEKAVRELAGITLQRNGYRVLEAGNGREAAQLAEQHTGPIHLLLTDVVMPEISGRELAERLAGRMPGMKVLYMSGYTDDAILHHRVLAPDIAFLQKPFTAKSLASKVRRVLDAVRES